MHLNGNRADVAAVGAGIVGLAHVLAAAKRGLKVVVLGRRPGWRGVVDPRRWDDLAKDPDARVSPLEEHEGDLWFVVSEHYDGAGLSRQNGIGFGAGDAQ